MVRVRKILFRDRQIEEKLDHNPVFKIEIKASPKMKGVCVEKCHNIDCKRYFEGVQNIPKNLKGT